MYRLECVYLQTLKIWTDSGLHCAEKQQQKQVCTMRQIRVREEEEEKE